MGRTAVPPAGAWMGFGVWVLVGAVMGGEGERERGGPPAVSYGRDIRPVLSDKCFPCHGPDAGTREADLALHLRTEALREREGVAAIVPGDVEGSELWHRISSDDEDYAMPPADTATTPLNAKERELLRRWIEQGAPYEAHWAFEPPQRIAAPDGADHPVDAWIARGLQQQGLAPNPPAPPELALRRLFLDLTGLPPTPEEVDTYLAALEQGDPDEVWAAQIETLWSQEPYRNRYAERMATPWLDQARYADTIGIHTDNGRQLWPWRDWVLRAYRDNLPFDQFLTEQLAGDLLPDATLEQQVASGFLRAHVITDEGGAIDEEYLVEYAVDRVDTVSQVWLGLTVSCARCHDHKFDPISQEDYYRLFAFFAQNDEPGLYSQTADPNRAYEPLLEVPSAEQSAQREQIAAQIASLRKSLEHPTPEEQRALAEFREGFPRQAGVQWARPKVLRAESQGGSHLTVGEDQVVLASGENPAVDVHRVTLQTDAQDLRLLQLDVLGHPSMTNGAPGRAGNGNAVLTGLDVRVRSVQDPAQERTLRWSWMWVDFAQANEDYSLERAFEHGPNKGWALGTHENAGDRVALLLAQKPFGYPGGTHIEVELRYESPYAQHAFGRVRIDASPMQAAALERLPVHAGRWYHAGPFPIAAGQDPFAARFGPELSDQLDYTQTFEGQGPIAWQYRGDWSDGQVHSLAAGVNVHYVARELYSATERELTVSIGSDDGFAIFVNGQLVAERAVARGCAPDQDEVRLPLRAGRNALLFKIINSGGEAGYYYRALPLEAGLSTDGVTALVDQGFRKNRDLDGRLAHAWRLSESETYRAGTEAIAALETSSERLEAQIPRTMVMRERMEPREVFLLQRGQYDHPDRERPLQPGIPALWGALPERADGQPNDRVDLARWMTSPDHPLVARVAVNRLWQMLMGRGLVATSGDFGLQGAWPSHRELLDTLAIEFIESGWDVQHVLRRIVTSHAYRQSSVPSEAARERDPDNVWLSHFPRRRLDGERIRDLALFTAGLLEERFGGPPVKPYQPPGLWPEVAMLASNTREYAPSSGPDLWRRSVYTYWKRACPPPTLLAFDAPTRESCVVERPITNTPLQALALWNDETFREAARVLAQRTLEEMKAVQPARRNAFGLERLFRRCTGRAPSAAEQQTLEATLRWARERYAADPEAARAWTQAGTAPMPSDLDTAEWAAWSLISSAVLNLHATITNG